MGQSGSAQVHDFNPGIAPSGLFWTVFPFPEDNVDFNLAHGTASMHATNWRISDFTSIANSLGLLTPPIEPVPATVSFALKWLATGIPTELPNDTTPTTGFAGTFRNSSAQLAWSAREKNFKYRSDPAATSTTVSGVIGQERNGRFFGHDD